MICGDDEWCSCAPGAHAKMKVRPLPPSMHRGAIISDNGTYRYFLCRSWAPGEVYRRVLFIMLNPSTADADVDDPTIRRCIQFAKDLGFNELAVVNLYALRATNPRQLQLHFSPLGPENDSHIRAAIASSDTVICAWGAMTFAEQRAAEVLALIRDGGKTPMCLRKTKDGSPGHPLYLPKTCRPEPL